MAINPRTTNVQKTPTDRPSIFFFSDAGFSVTMAASVAAVPSVARVPGVCDGDETEYNGLVCLLTSGAVRVVASTGAASKP